MNASWLQQVTKKYRPLLRRARRNVLIVNLGAASALVFLPMPSAVASGLAIVSVAVSLAGIASFAAEAA